MKGTTASWISKVENASNEELEAIKEELRVNIAKMYEDKRIIDEEKDRINMLISFTEDNLAMINKKIKEKPFVDENFNKRDLILTDHAVLRYIERILGFNVEGIKREIINNFPDKVPLDSTSVRAGKTVYKLIRRDTNHLLVTTIIKKR